MITFKPRFWAAFWVLILVLKLELKNKRPMVLFFPSAWSANGSFLAAMPLVMSCGRSATSLMDRKCFIQVKISEIGVPILN
ncbi:hypothetical protein D3C86_1822040 [compost metagenome]